MPSVPPDTDPTPTRRGARGRIDRFLAHPSSIKYAAAAIVAVTLALVFFGAAALRLFDHDEYPTMGTALWFSLQTVTTVGYGDNTPANEVGRVIATIMMLTAVGLITVITAIITSTFVAAAGQRSAELDPPTDREGITGLHASLEAIAQRMERLEANLAGREQADSSDEVGDRN
jgi:voltage-gated potassium channel